jgi:hypothetical protein
MHWLRASLGTAMVLDVDRTSAICQRPSCTGPSAPNLRRRGSDTRPPSARTGAADRRALDRTDTHSLCTDDYPDAARRRAFVASRASLTVAQVRSRSRSAVTGAARKMPAPVRTSWFGRNGRPSRRK